jgi:dTDP-4-amino-4,6-dideoxygalactose transaminase
MSELTAAVGVAQLAKMEWVIGQMRAHKARAVRGIGGLPGVRVRPLPDPAGETGATLIFSVPSAAAATRVAAALTAENVKASVPWTSGQHVYYHFDQLIERRFLSKRHCAWECPHYKGKATLRKGQFPRTDQILQQAVHIDLHPLLAESDVDDIVTAIDKVTTALL